MNTIFLIICSILTISVISLIVKVISLKKSIRNYINDASKRHGVIYYRLRHSGTGEKCTVKVFVKEIERFTNGKSKIVIEKIEAPESSRPEAWCEKARSFVSSMMMTKEIQWLESENKEEQKEKIDKLKKG